MDDEEQILQTGFCTKCTADSTSETPGSISTMNGIGRKFYGGAEKCPTCGSVVRVLWFVFVEVPLIPLGTYRYQESEKGVMRSRFLGRKTHTRWPQVFLHWSVGLMLGFIAVMAIMAWSESKRHR